MTTYIIRRLLMGLLIIFLVTTVVFFSVRLLPGDPILLYMAQSQQLQTMTPEQLQKLRAEFGLDKPVPVQYINWLGQILRGDLGTSIHYREKVSQLLLKRMPVTLYLGAISLVVSTVLGILAGLAAAMKRGQFVDSFITALAYLGQTVPVFWLGIVLMLVFGLWLGWLPIAGYTSPRADFWLSTRQIVMPVICLSIGGLAAIARQTRNTVLEVIRQDYIRTAWAKGLSERRIVMRHVLKNSLIPVVTTLGLIVSQIIGGSVLVETIFSIPGMGRLLVGSVFDQDYVVLQSGTLVIATFIVLVNLIVDISYGWLDPRIRYE